MQTARILTTGESQSVELPAEFRLDSQEGYIRRDEKSPMSKNPQQRPTYKSFPTAPAESPDNRRAPASVEWQGC